MPEGFSTRCGRRFHFDLPAAGVYCDLEKGELVLKPKRNNFPAQNVTLAFAVSLLYLMVQPRPKEGSEQSATNTALRTGQPTPRWGRNI